MSFQSQAALLKYLCLKKINQFIFISNDVYNIDVKKSEPIGGASRFVASVKQNIAEAGGENCFVTFGGDAFSPAPLTRYTMGSEMPPIMNLAQTSVACVGEFVNTIEEINSGY